MPCEKNVVSAAIIGCGTIAPIHADALAAMPQVRLCALADPDDQAAKALAEVWRQKRPDDPAPRCFASLADLLDAQTLDVVHICTPHHTHVALTRQALAAGAWVLLEKPPGISREDEKELLQLQVEYGPKIALCYQNRFNEASLQAFMLLRSQLSGRVRGARAWVTWQRDAAYYQQAAWRGQWSTEGGGVMINQAIHTLDLLLWLCGMPQTVQGSCHQYRLANDIEVEDTAQAYMTFADGATALFYATNAYALDAPTFLDLHAETLQLRLEGNNLAVYTGSDTPLASDQVAALLEQADAAMQAMELDEEDAYWLQSYRALQQQNRKKSVLLPGKEYWGESHARLIEAFYHDLKKHGKMNFPIGAQQGCQALSVLLALYEAHQNQQTIDMKTIQPQEDR